MKIRKACRWVVENVPTIKLVSLLPAEQNKYAISLLRISHTAHWSATPLVSRNNQLEIILIVHDEMRKYARYLQIAAQTNDLFIFRKARTILKQLEDLASALL
mmetsp:Transcript_18434/g.33210  ORF Transcript_18434/g.33210 Transcript_18434/m.33210 type:complete len:103 (+) Transcript_18434:3879-4187(+)